jgi:lipid-A-disaccharide synthase-like uncharacterized protein
MLIELARDVIGYLQEVFIHQLDWWVALGFAAQLMFFGRFLVQWIASERVGRSVVPIGFWFLSVAGGTLLLVYAIYRRDPVFILGQGGGLLIYLRNLYFIYRERRASVAAP